MQIGITSIGVLSGIVGEAAMAEPFARWLQGFGLAPATSFVVATGFVVVIVTYVSIVVGELVPKRLAQFHPEAIARATRSAALRKDHTATASARTYRPGVACATLKGPNTG